MNKEVSILVIDNNSSHADAVVAELSDLGMSIDAVVSAQKGIEAVSSRRIDLVISGVTLDGQMGGLEVLSEIKNISPATQVILLAEHASVETCKEAIKQGAFDYFVKPVDLSQLKQAVENALPRNIQVVDGGRSKGFVFEGVVGRSRHMHNVFHVIRRVAQTNISVLIEGESGTEKN